MEACVDDIEVATSEACTNVLKHVENSSEQYEVQVEVDPEACRIKIIDSGDGFDASQHQDGQAKMSMTAEGGRGIFLMQAMVDRLEFISEPHNGTVVHLLKKLKLEEGSVLREFDSQPKP
jgi:serine/threonine-protein kinase RsbW